MKLEFAQSAETISCTIANKRLSPKLSTTLTTVKTADLMGMKFMRLNLSNIGTRKETLAPTN